MCHGWYTLCRVFFSANASLIFLGDQKWKKDLAKLDLLMIWNCSLPKNEEVHKEKQKHENQKECLRQWKISRINFQKVSKFSIAPIPGQRVWSYFLGKCLMMKSVFPDITVLYVQSQTPTKKKKKRPSSYLTIVKYLIAERRFEVIFPRQSLITQEAILPLNEGHLLEKEHWPQRS